MNQNYMIQLMMQQQKKTSEGFINGHGQASRHSIAASKPSAGGDSQSEPFDRAAHAGRFDPFKPNYANMHGLNPSNNHPTI